MSRKWWFVLILGTLGLVGGLILLQVNLSTLARSLASRQIPGLTFSDLRVGWGEIEVVQLDYRPREAERSLLVADAVAVRPSLFSFLTDTFRLWEIRIESPVLFLERERDGGVLLPLPPGREEAPGEGTSRSLHIESLDLRSGILEFVDHSVGDPPARYRWRNVQVQVRDIRHPAGAEPLHFEISAVLEGAQDARLRLVGWRQALPESGRMVLELEHLEPDHFAPYLRNTETTNLPAGGTLGLQAELELDPSRYRVQGTLVLDQFTFATPQGRFLGVPVLLLDGFLKAQDHRLELPFRMEGERNGKGGPGGLAGVLSQALIEAVGPAAIDAFRDQLRREGEGGSQGLDQLKEGIRRLRDRFQ